MYVLQLLRALVVAQGVNKPGIEKPPQARTNFSLRKPFAFVLFEVVDVRVIEEPENVLPALDVVHQCVNHECVNPVKR
jgi:hypothetical protein